MEEYRLSKEDAGSTAFFVIAGQLSAGARDILCERNIGYFDASGSLYFKHKDWLINIDRPAKPVSPRRAGSLFTGAREQVVHALLHSNQRWLTGLEIADLAETSAYTVSLTLRELERLELVESRGSGRTLRRRLIQPGVLLDLWADAWRVRKEHKTRWFAYTRNPNAILSAITDKLESEALTGWAFTGTAAANAVSPLLTHVESADTIVPLGSTPDYAKALGLQEVEKGSNVTLIERGGASSLFTREHSDHPSHLASAFIMYLDLLDGRGRNKELASQLRSDILKI
ncbi:type IV toxin-antitoxin system AbiEi family antitoxin [Cupriavidus sp. D39]|uniref:type IV toxin-antitoxin system AbiEi family antitoxin n=1 Tax=Cupriavidus sp. D39 TaxID=2997877 RepID=UPI00226DBA51|nr:type IV toxin-antitoxin system AbiEi family antitoxin [Cupriavidus sp. D39]MCY0857127.1 type IV toxin-antitoxin system AbiEi family antitoxin [Cupriavidus sp. D39]